VSNTSIGQDVRRGGRKLTQEEFEARLRVAPEKIKWVGGIFVSDRQRLIVLGMLQETLGVDAAVRFGDLEVWEAAVAARRASERSGQGAR
jgi:hypothetical protein